MPFKDPVKRQEYKHRWYLAHKQATIHRAKNWKDKNPEKRKHIANKWAKKDYARRPEHYRKRSLLWAKENPLKCVIIVQRRRARLHGNGGTWTTAQWNHLKRAYNNSCLGCRLGETQLKCLRRKLVPDHIQPVARGGRNDISNLQPLCHGLNGCNNRKGSRHVDYRRAFECQL